MTELAMPREIRTLGAIPVLGTDTVDYVALASMAVGPDPSARCDEPFGETERVDA